MKPFVFILSLLFAYAPLAVADTFEESPAEVVRIGVTNVLTMLEDKDMSIEERRHQLHEIISSRFDFHEMSFRIMAQNWKKFNDQQKAEFESGLVDMLEDVYFKAINEYSSEKVNVGGERIIDPEHATVIVTIVRDNGSDIPLLFKMHRKSDGAWKAYDANVEGISLVSHYRDRLGKIMAREGVDGVLAYLKTAKEQHEAPGV